MGTYLLTVLPSINRWTESRFSMNCLHFRWSQHILRTLQYIRSHYHVHLLSDRSPRSAVPEVHLVEEVFNRVPNGKLVFTLPNNRTDRLRTYTVKTGRKHKPS